MKCFKCGADMPVGSKFCKKCGGVVDITYQNPVAQGQSTHTGMMPKGGEIHANAGSYAVLQGAYGDQQGGSGPCTASLVLGIVADVSVAIAIIIGAMAAKRDSQLWGLVGAVDPSVTEITVAGIFMFVGVICSIIGFIMAVYGLAKKRKGKGRAIGGLVCSLIVLLPFVLPFFFLFFI